MKRRRKTKELKNSRQVIVEYYKAHPSEFIENELDVKLNWIQKMVLNIFLKGI